MFSDLQEEQNIDGVLKEVNGMFDKQELTLTGRLLPSNHTLSKAPGYDTSSFQNCTSFFFKLFLLSQVKLRELLCAALANQISE